MTVPPDHIDLPGAQLRRFTVDDAPAVVRSIEESLDHLEPWMPWAAMPETLEVEFQRNRIRDNAEKFATGETYEYGLFAPDGERVLGSFGLMDRRGPGTLELGYWVHVDVSGRGHGTNAARALVDVALAVDGVETAIIVCDEANARSAAIPRRLGFTLASVTRRAPQAPGEIGREMVWTKARATA